MRWQLLHELLLSITWPPALGHLQLAVQQDPGTEFRGQKWREEEWSFQVYNPLLSLNKTGHV